MNYGELYWASPDPNVGSEQAGRRPVLVLSSDAAIEIITSVVTTIPLTTRDRGWASHIQISGPDTGLAQPSWALCEQIRTISTHRIANRIGVVDTTTLTSVNQVLRHLLNL